VGVWGKREPVVDGVGRRWEGMGVYAKSQEKGDSRALQAGRFAPYAAERRGGKGPVGIRGHNPDMRSAYTYSPALTGSRVAHYIARHLRGSEVLMSIIKSLFSSSVGKKFVMAVSGLVLFLFVVGHMIGNLQIFAGRDAINTYAELLHGSNELLWLVRLFLISAVVLHVWSAASLTAENRAARPKGYEGNPPSLEASYASRTMVMSGLIIAIFVIYHLLHFTARIEAVNLTGVDFQALKETMRDGSERQDVYRMVIIGFQNPIVSLFYVVGVGLVCFHLSHGMAAMMQSMGWTSHRSRPVIDRVSVVIAWVLFIGYIATPIAVWLGLGRQFVL
jgi:succinate dehydrogenase / fumarate reductase, cytochrome b subunit